MFEYLHSRAARLAEDFNPTKGKGPILLRLTNELKRRLSRETDAAFIGRIMTFVSSSLPPWERSGVNLRGNYNVESITKYEEPEQDESKMKVDKDDEGTGMSISECGLTQTISIQLFGHYKNISRIRLYYILNKFWKSSNQNSIS